MIKEEMDKEEMDKEEMSNVNNANNALLQSMFVAFTVLALLA